MSRSVVSSLWMAVPLVAGLVSCDALKPAPPALYPVVIRVESDPGRPVAGATIMKGGKEGPATGPDGTVTVAIPGHEGDRVDLLVRCPADYVTSPKPLTISLKRESKVPEYASACPPAVRHLVVAIRAEHGPNLPVIQLGKVIGKTDASGAFTALFALKPGDPVELTLDTTKSKRRLRPSNPTGVFVMKDHDDVVAFTQKFSWDPARVRAASQGPVGPVRF